MTTHIMLDIEALGTRPGCALTEIGAVAFCPESGNLGESFEVDIRPAMPLLADLATLEWHAKHGTWPHERPTIPLRDALSMFAAYVAGFGEIEALWCWGATYDFPILTAAFDAMAIPPPWHYWQCQCARTVWNLACPGEKHSPRPHRAVQDAVAAARDLMLAMERRSA